MVLDRDKLKKLLKEKGVKSLEDFNDFMRDVSKDVIETLLDEELTEDLPPGSWSRSDVSFWVRIRKVLD